MTSFEKVGAEIHQDTNIVPCRCRPEADGRGVPKRQREVVCLCPLGPGREAVRRARRVKVETEDLHGTGRLQVDRGRAATKRGGVGAIIRELRVAARPDRVVWRHVPRRVTTGCDDAEKRSTTGGCTPGGITARMEFTEDTTWAMARSIDTEGSNHTFSVV